MARAQDGTYGVTAKPPPATCRMLAVFRYASAEQAENARREVCDRAALYGRGGQWIDPVDLDESRCADVLRLRGGRLASPHVDARGVGHVPDADIADEFYWHNNTMTR